jgi:putative sterol carrier protein
MATLEEVTAQIRAAVGKDSGLGKSVKLNLKSDGFVLIDGATVSNEDGAADLTITLSLQNLLAMGQGALDPVMAIMLGKMKCSDLGTLIALQNPLKAIIAKVHGGA